MRIVQGKNVLCTLRVKTAPIYVEKSKNTGSPWMYCSGSTRANDETGRTADFTYQLRIFGDAAIPAAKTILPGALLLVGGRTDSWEGKKKDYVCILVDFWMPIVQDPYHYTDILEAQMKMLAQMHLGNFYTAVSGGDEPAGDEENDGSNSSDSGSADNDA